MDWIDSTARAERQLIKESERDAEREAAFEDLQGVHNVVLHPRQNVCTTRWLTWRNQRMDGPDFVAMEEEPDEDERRVHEQRYQSYYAMYGKADSAPARRIGPEAVAWGRGQQVNLLLESWLGLVAGLRELGVLKHWRAVSMEQTIEQEVRTGGARDSKEASLVRNAVPAAIVLLERLDNEEVEKVKEVSGETREWLGRLLDQAPRAFDRLGLALNRVRWASRDSRRGVLRRARPTGVDLFVAAKKPALAGDSGEAASPRGGGKKRGRPPKADPVETQTLVKAWETRRFKEYVDVDREFGKPPGTTKGAVDRNRKARETEGGA